MNDKHKPKFNYGSEWLFDFYTNPNTNSCKYLIIKFEDKKRTIKPYTKTNSNPNPNKR